MPFLLNFRFPYNSLKLLRASYFSDVDVCFIVPLALESLHSAVTSDWALLVHAVHLIIMMG